MNKSFNNTIIIGRLKDDPRRITRNDKDCLKFIVCHVLSDQTVDEHDVFAFGKQADLCERYLHKGDLCCVEGSVRKSELNGKFTDIVSKKVTFLTNRR